MSTEGWREDATEPQNDDALDLVMESRRLPERAMIDLPDGLDPSVAARVNGLIEAAVAAGWTIGPIDWVSQAVKTIRFVAKPPLGKPIFVLCEEGGMVTKLQSVLGGVETGRDDCG